VTGRRVTYLVSSVIFLAFMFVIVSRDEWISCHLENISKGHFWTPDFSSEIVITENGRSKRLDFTRLQQFKRICVVSMYTYGEVSGGGKREEFRLDGPKACWRETDGALTIAGILANGFPNWTHLIVEWLRPIYQFSGDACVDRENAILVCSDQVCSFGR
jgi:hypothetical protein